MKVFLVHFESESENEVSVVSDSRDWTQVSHSVGRRLYCLSHQEILVHFIITLFHHIQPQSQTSKDLFSVIYISFHFQKVYIYGVI